ncbi:diguanylate cyclase [Niveibacterium umoris]|uniref:Diguanylate cyclase (GGDEF)-like protein/PAS domain S-box-containing protein n=1 Tax=Niveibacterium umoris TaxID=1193620 RepID=A0A840BQ44_9RHOO|nr:diguanylate cyclase (GGDEF)-like protein/PAS domain S-box-containing protein [Niveibacterium umoris]
MSELDVLQLTQLITQIPGAVFQLLRRPDGEWAVVYVSRGIQVLFGVDAAQVGDDGRGLINRIDPHDRRLVREAVDAASASLKPLICEFRVARATDEVAAIRCHAIPERAPEGGVLWSGVLTDISDLKAVETALQENEERLRLALKAANQGLYDLNVATGEARVNDEYALMLGYDPHSFHETNAAWIARLHPDDHETTARAYREYVEGRTADYQVEFRQRTRDGKWKWILSLGCILERDEEGRPLRMLGTHTDISERKRREQALAESEERLALATRHNGIGIWDLDLRTRRMVWDESMYALYHVSKDAFSGTEAAWRATLHPDDLARADHEVREAIAKGTPLETEFRVCWPSGEIRYIRAVAKIFHGADGTPQRMLGTNIDITERKQLEIALRHQAHTDHLTGVGSRGFFMEQAELEINRAARYGNALSIFMLDIDHFKQINDTYGHRAGDRVLIALADCCRATLREVDVIGRIGGEEFAVLLPNAPEQEAADVGERLRATIAGTAVALDDTTIVRITVSIGITTVQAGESDVDRVLKRADDALYEAKHLGRNRVCVGRPAPMARADEATAPR